MKKKSDCTMEYAKDPFGKEILLKDGKFQVMMEWEKPYMQACIDALQPFGDVLEIGFGCGYSATHIQKFSPKSHTIIEYHPIVAAKAREWAASYPNIKIIEDTWQNALSSLGVFDAVFFDDYPLESEKQMKKMEEEKASANALLQEGRDLISGIDSHLSFIKELIYSDEDLEELFTHFASNESVELRYLLRFLQEISSCGQITQAQRKNFLERLEKKGYQVAEILEEAAPQTDFIQFRGPNERLLVFLEQILNSHMRTGGRFSCFLSSSISKYEDLKFVESVICNPFLDYKEHWIDVDVPSNCDYYQEDKALVITITKSG
ncbi:MAG: hypothetical protein HYZ48_03855 [Chlamydiales bacterium]|nr:hypothetical protein [Chlamydiales bacterium]